MSNWHTQHFNKIAKVIREKRENDHQRGRELDWEMPRLELLDELTLEFAVYFKEQNEIFDERKFIEACGFSPTKT